MIKDDRLYLSHILDCIDRICEYTSGGRNDFMVNRKTQDAVMRNFEIIGEAVKQISEETLRKTPDIPWRRIAGFRDVLIHGYMGIDLEEVWNVIANDLDNLKEAVNYLLK